MTLLKNKQPGDILTATDLNDSFAEFNDLSASYPTDFYGKAKFANSQLANSYFEFPIVFNISQAQYAAITASPTVPVLAIPVLGELGQTYTVSKASYCISNVGGRTAAFRVDWGYQSGGTWYTTSNVIATFTASGPAADQAETYGGFAIATSSLAMTIQPRCLALFCSTKDATALDGTPASQMTFTVWLKRQLRS